MALDPTQDVPASSSPAVATDPSNPKISSTDNQPFNIFVKTPQKDVVSFQASLADTILDLKQYLFEAKEICYVTSYNILYKGKEVNEFGELSELPDLKEGSTLEMVEAPYNSISMSHHIRRLRDLLSVTSEKPISVLSSLATSVQSLKDSVAAPKQQPKSNTAITSGKGKKKRQKKKKKSNNSSNASLDIPPQSRTASQESLDLNFDEFKLSDFFPSQKTAPQCIHSICYSGWNPPPGNRRCRGDLCYLVIRTLENRIIHVTGSTEGFFINSSTNNTFDPEPADKFISHTLVGLLNSVSPLFRNNFQNLLEEHFEKHPFEVFSVTFAEQNFPWLADSSAQHTFDLNRTEDFIQGRLSGESSALYEQLRDWNAEYQACKELPKSTAQERIFRDRAIYKVYQDFICCSVIGAKAIVTGSVNPVNPNDPPPARLYIYNNIFFSHALSGRFLYEEEGGDMGPYKQVNNDLRGVITYNIFDIPELYTVLTTLVDYRGYRMVAQSIIPGILHQTGNNCIQYGAIDRGETLAWNEDFHKLICQVGKLLHIPEHEVEDEEGHRVKLCCCSDTKGVMGTDGRKYVLDLDRTSVRDLNFNQAWTLIRLELYDIYIDYLKRQHVIKHKAKYEELARREAKQQALAKEAQTETQSETPQTTQTQKTENNENPASNEADQNQSDSTDKPESDESNADIEIPEFIPPKFNPNALAMTHGKLVGDPEEIQAAEEQVRTLCAFLNDTVIPALVQEIVTNVSYPTDSATLTGLFHSHGVNLRYLGKVTELIGTQKPFIRDLFIREMIVRSTKHIMSKFLRSLKENDFASGVSHFLNCFIRGAFVQNFCNPNAPAQSHVSERFGVTPEGLWISISEQIKEQFKFEYKNEFKASKYMLQALRLLCQKCGLQLLARNYDFYSPQPISEDDLQGFFPVVKNAAPVNLDGHDLLDGGKSFLMQGRIDLAFEFLTEALAMFHQTYGPMHSFTAHCYSNLAMVLYHAGDFNQALLHQKKAVIIHERTRGLDHHETAFGYANLGLFCHQNSQTHLALKFIKRSLYLSDLIAGPDHPDNTSTFSNIAMILQDHKNYKEALDYLQKALECTETHYGLKHPNTAAACHSVAIAYSMLDGFKSALQYERRSYDILQELVGVNDIRTVEANIWLKQFTAKVVQLESSKAEAQKTAPQKTNDPGKIPTLLNNDQPDSSNISNLPISDLLRYINNTDSVIGRQQRLRAGEYNSSKILRSVGPKRN